MSLKLESLKFKEKLKNLRKSWNKQNHILYEGLAEYKNILLYLLPSVLAIVFFLFSSLTDISIKKIFANILTIMPSILGFLIASAAIIISIDNEKLKESPRNCKFNYKQIGGSIFFAATKYSFLILLIAFLCPEKSSNTFLINYSYIISPLVKLLIFLILSRIIVLVFYGLMFLSSSISNNTEAA